MKQKKLQPVLGFFLFSLIIITSALLGGYFWVTNQLQPVDSSSTKTQNFIIKKGESIDSIGKNLQTKKLIKSPFVFKLVIKYKQLGTKIQAGSFKLSGSQSLLVLIDNLTHGKQDIWITILEGWRREEIATYLAKELTANSINFDPQVFLNLTQDKEGFLFPDTYLIPLTATEDTIISILENTLEQKITAQMLADIKSQNKTLPQIITMASLIEREAKTDSSRKMVSGILWRRISESWPLQVDATLQYLKGYDSKTQNWWNPPNIQEKENPSPYNTYINQGLPPHPICSPSLSSIMAAIYPTTSTYWFYLTDNQGQMHYANTLTEHNQNVNQYLK